MSHVLYSTKYRSIIKAVLFCELFPDVAIFSKENYQNNLFRKEVYFDVDGLSFEKIYESYKKRYGEIDWLFDKKGHFKGYLLEATVRVAFLHSDKNKFDTIETALKDALCEGPQYVLEKASKAGKDLFSLYRQVIMEVHKCSGFIRFQPFESEKEKILVGYYEPEHKTERMLLKHFSKRYKGFKIILRTPETVFFLNQEEVRELPSQDFDFNLPPDQFEKLWETYYDSTYIPERKNKIYAMNMMPKKYWSWIKEGVKIEKPNCK